MKTSAIKSVLLGLALGGASLFIGGCAHGGLGSDPLAPPAYSSTENAQRQWRYAAYDWSQAIEDVDTDILMTRPASMLSHWNVRQSD